MDCTRYENNLAGGSLLNQHTTPCWTPLNYYNFSLKDSNGTLENQGVMSPLMFCPNKENRKIRKQGEIF